MLKDFGTQIKYTFSQFSFKKKRNIEKELKDSFGKSKNESFDFEKIEVYFKNKSNSDAYQILSDKTCNDLDFDELFMMVDRTQTKVGQQYLYNRLRTLIFNPSQTNLNEEIIELLSKNPELRISIQKKLKNLQHKDAYYISTLFQEKHVARPRWFFLIKLLSLASILSVVLSFFYPVFILVLIGLFCTNFAIHYWNKNNLVEYVGSIPQLLKLNSIATSLYAIPELKKISPHLQKSIQVINQVRNRMSFFQLESRIQGDSQVIAWFIFENIKTLFLIEPLLLFGALKSLDTRRNEIENVFMFVGHVDMLISIASLRNGLDIFCIPEINPNENKIIANEINHPLIINCQPNSIQITEKSVLLTGSNMSGKTSFIRSLGLNIITGLTLNTCFAKSLSFPVLKIFSAIRISDDLMNNKSYYFEEILTIKEMLSENQEISKNLFLLDELFKGTNTIERISAGKAVLSALNKNNNIVIVSTHDIELTDLLANEYDLYHFSEVINNNSVGFDYQLKKGKLKNRNAIRILEINGFPKEIIKEAMSLSQILDKNYWINK